jgi:hypothetical protein
MNFKKVSLSVLAFLALTMTRAAFAEQKLMACMTLGQFNSGAAVGFRLYHDDAGQVTAVLNSITMWHGVVVNFEPTPLRTVVLEESFTPYGDRFSGEGFLFQSYAFGFPTGPLEEAGRISVDLNGNRIDLTALIADDFGRGFCK